MRAILASAFNTLCFYTGKSLVYTLSLGHLNPDWRDSNAQLVEAGGFIVICATTLLATLLLA